jgi:hypothetical protein
MSHRTDLEVVAKEEVLVAAGDRIPIAHHVVILMTENDFVLIYVNSLACPWLNRDL